MLSCQELARLVSSGEIENLKWNRRMEIRFHLLMCRVCRQYKQQIEKIGSVARKWASRLSNSKDIQAMEESLIETMKSHRK